MLFSRQFECDFDINQLLLVLDYLVVLLVGLSCYYCCLAGKFQRNFDINKFATRMAVKAAVVCLLQRTDGITVT